MRGCRDGGICTQVPSFCLKLIHINCVRSLSNTQATSTSLVPFTNPAVPLTHTMTSDGPPPHLCAEEALKVCHYPNVSLNSLHWLIHPPNG